MTPTQIKTLRTMADELAEMAEDAATPTDASAYLRKASYSVQNAIGELVQSAAHQNGLVGAMPYEVLREKIAA
jgi:hypothetical protein